MADVSSRDDALLRIAELERRVLDGADDFAYCMRWIGIHSAIVRVIDVAEGRG